MDNSNETKDKSSQPREIKMTHRDKSKSNASETATETQSELENDANKLRPSLWEEFCFLAVREKKWWLVPILIPLALIAVAVAFRQTATVPFI